MVSGDELPAVRIGLCARCRHMRAIVSRRGSKFFHCERSRTDNTFPKYPALPVLVCDGWEIATETAEDSSG